MAMEIYQAAIKQVRLIDDKPGMQDCLTNMGIAYQQRSFKQKTESDLDIALDFHKKVNGSIPEWGIAVTKNNPNRIIMQSTKTSKISFNQLIKIYFKK